MEIIHNNKSYFLNVDKAVKDGYLTPVIKLQRGDLIKGGANTLYIISDNDSLISLDGYIYTGYSISRIQELMLTTGWEYIGKLLPIVYKAVN